MSTVAPRCRPPASSVTGGQLSKQLQKPCTLAADRRILRGVPFKLLKKKEVSPFASSTILLREKLLRAQHASPDVFEVSPSQHQQQQQQRQQQQQQQQQPVRAAATCLHSRDGVSSARAPDLQRAPLKEIGLQTDPHVVVLTAAAKETEAEAQTDKVWDRPPSPLVALRAELVDVDTQIQDGDLFNFDEEVVPVLEVLIGRVIEQSLNEVLEEEELRAIRQQREAFERERLQQMIAVQALEAAEERRQQEAARRVAEETARKKLQVFAAQKQCAVACASKLLEGMETAVLREMEETGEFLSPLTPAVEVSLWPRIQREAIKLATHDTAINSQVLEGFAAAALTPTAAEVQDLVVTRKKRAAIHLQKKLKQVEAFDNLLARKRREAEERRCMEQADDLDATRAWERHVEELEEQEETLLEAEDINVLLLEGDTLSETEEEGQETEEAEREEDTEETAQ